MKGLSRHSITVDLEGRDEPVTLLSANPDLIQWDETRARKGWPKADEAPNLWMTFVAWCAARRTGLWSDGWDSWRDACLDINLGTPEAVDPTQTGHGSV